MSTTVDDGRLGCNCRNAAGWDDGRANRTVSVVESACGPQLSQAEEMNLVRRSTVEELETGNAMSHKQTQITRHRKTQTNTDQ